MSKDERIAQLTRQVAELNAALAVALARIKELEEQLNKTSRNSDKPPSSDGLKKAPALPKVKKKRGGQRGHKGNTLRFSGTVDEHVVHPAPAVCGCGACLQGVEERTGTERRQVHELPPLRLRVTEHRVAHKRCPACGEVGRGSFPDHLTAPVQYGPGVRALAVLLHTRHGLPLERTSGLFADLFDRPLNQATILAAQRRAHQRAARGEELIRDELAGGKVLKVDESGARVAGKLHWIHASTDERWTYYYIHQKRGGIALRDAAAVLPRFKGWAIHDCWSPYFGFDCKHGLCNAHLLRELRALAEGQGNLWAAMMHELLLEMHAAVRPSTGRIPRARRLRFEHRYDQILRLADQYEPPPAPRKRGRAAKSKGRNLMERLGKHRRWVLAFAKHAAVPFTNNAAERAVRIWKTKLKVSGGFRTSEGARHYARLCGFFQSAIQQQRNVFDELKQLLIGNSFVEAALV